MSGTWTTFVALVALGWWALAPSAIACECFSIDAASHPLDGYPAIFSGMVRSVKNVEVTSPTGGISVKLVCFTIDRLWKGNREAVQRVYTGLGGPDCGFPFEAGRRYVVTAEPGESFYGGLGPKTLFASRCSLTTAADRGAELTKRLDRELGGSTQQRD